MCGVCGQVHGGSPQLRVLPGLSPIKSLSLGFRVWRRVVDSYRKFSPEGKGVTTFLRGPQAVFLQSLYCQCLVAAAALGKTPSAVGSPLSGLPTAHGLLSLPPLACRPPSRLPSHLSRTLGSRPFPLGAVITDLCYCGPWDAARGAVGLGLGADFVSGAACAWIEGKALCPPFTSTTTTALTPFPLPPKQGRSFFCVLPESCWRNWEVEQVHAPRVTQNVQRKKLRASLRVSHNLCHVSDHVFLTPFLPFFRVPCVPSVLTPSFHPSRVFLPLSFQGDLPSQDRQTKT